MDDHKEELQEIRELPEQPEQEAPREEEAQQPPHRPRAMFFLLLGIFSAVFILSSIYLIHYFMERNEAANRYDELNQIVDSMQNAQTTQPTEPDDTQPPSSEPTDPSEPPATEAPAMLPEYAAIYAMNQDLVGWINIPALKIKYPVMQTPDRPDYYLRRDFYGEYNTSGCLYVREACDVFAPSDNVVIYGHAMKTGDMFGRLYYYRDKSYWEKHPYFTFDTLYEHHDYQIFAVFRTSGTWGVGYPYHMFNDTDSEEAFNQFIANVKGAAFTMDTKQANGTDLYLGSVYYDTGITPKYGDQLVTLSTCEYSIRDPGTNTKNGRLVIVAVRVDCVCGQ